MDQLGQPPLKLALLPAVLEKLSQHFPFYVTSFFTKGETLAHQLQLLELTSKSLLMKITHESKGMIQEYPIALPQAPPSVLSGPQSSHNNPVVPKPATGFQVSITPLQSLHPTLQDAHVQHPC